MTEEDRIRILDLLERSGEDTDFGLEFFILGEDGEPKRVPMLVWAEWFGQHKHIAYDEGDGWWVSSIFLGFDHAMPITGAKPLFWETATELRGYQDRERFSTRKDCLDFHRSKVEDFKR